MKRNPMTWYCFCGFFKFFFVVANFRGLFVFHLCINYAKYIFLRKCQVSGRWKINELCDSFWIFKMTIWTRIASLKIYFDVWFHLARFNIWSFLILTSEKLSFARIKFSLFVQLTFNDQLVGENTISIMRNFCPHFFFIWNCLSKFCKQYKNLPQKTLDLKLNRKQLCEKFFRDFYM